MGQISPICPIYHLSRSRLGKQIGRQASSRKPHPLAQQDNIGHLTVPGIPLHIHFSQFLPPDNNIQSTIRTETPTKPTPRNNISKHFCRLKATFLLFIFLPRPLSFIRSSLLSLTDPQLCLSQTIITTITYRCPWRTSIHNQAVSLAAHLK
jgi:hypothetical protein